MSLKLHVTAIIAAAALATAASAQTTMPAGVTDALADATWTFSNDGGKTFTLKTLEARGSTKVFARATFTLDDPAAVGGLFVVRDRNLEHSSFTLNGKPLTGLLKRMIYVVIPADPAEHLVKGTNVLVVSGQFRHRGKKPAGVRLKPQLRLLPPKVVGIQTGPALGAIGADFFTVTCRTNMPAVVTVTAKVGQKETSAESKRGFYHRLRVALPAGIKTFTYTATSRCGSAEKTDGPFTVKVPGADGTLRLAAAGDSRSHPDRWKSVAAAILKAEPDLLLFSGDLVGHGRWDHAWDVEFFGPARELLATVPLYPVLGNHDHHAAAFFELFYTPSEDGRAANWSQTIAGVQMVGIDGDTDWTKLAPWLDKTLKADSPAKFIFLLTHYPAWSSSNHGLRPDGGMGSSRKVVMPRLAKVRATALIAGHDHCYERLEPPPGKGVTCIVTGGAGAPTYGKRGPTRGSDYSKAFRAKLHYCIFDIKGDTCEMKVYDLEDKIIDQKTFKARQVPAEKKSAA